MSYGYSLRLTLLNSTADDNLLGVRLGRECITKGISVIRVARMFGVSRQTVYNWFSGVSSPNFARVPAVEEYITSLG